jgi:hypothetical protein
MHPYIEVVRDFGPVLGVILFFIWRDWKREDAMTKRIQALEEFQQNQLLDLIKKTNDVVAHNTEQLKWVAALVQNCQRREQ